MWNIIPSFKLTQSRRAIETNCGEQALKRSFTLRADCEYGWSLAFFDKVFSDNSYGLSVLKDDKGFSTVVKPDLFAMNFVNNPKNFIYLKAS